MVPCAYAILYVLLAAPFSYLICEGKYSLVMNSILPMKGTVNPMLSPRGLIYFKPHLRGLGGGGDLRETGRLILEEGVI